MRIFHGLLLIVMLLFIAMQFNDPDGLLWIGIYGIPALLMVVAIVRPKWISLRFWRALRWGAIAIMGAGVVYFWPDTAEFWRKEIWLDTETASTESVREGMGMMIAFLVTASAFLVSTLSKKQPLSTAS